MKQLLYLLAFGLLVPSAALARVDPNVAAQCQDARDFYGCVRAFTTPVRRSDDIAPFDGVMGQVAAGLISGPSYRNAPTTFPRGMNPAGLVEGGRPALNRIGPHSLVAARPESIGAAGGGVFGFAAAYPLAPELER